MYNFRCYVQMYSYGRPCSVTFFRLNVAWGEKLFSCLAVWWDRPEGSSSKRERAGCVGSTVNFLALSLNLEL